MQSMDRISNTFSVDSVTHSLHSDMTTSDYNCMYPGRDNEEMKSEKVAEYLNVQPEG